MKLTLIEVIIVLFVILLSLKVYYGAECHAKGGVLYEWLCVRANILN